MILQFFSNQNVTHVLEFGVKSYPIWAALPPGHCPIGLCLKCLGVGPPCGSISKSGFALGFWEGQWKISILVHMKRFQSNSLCPIQLKLLQPIRLA